MRTVRQLLEAAGSGNVLSRYAALTEDISGDVAIEVASEWGGGAHVDKTGGKTALAGEFVVNRKASHEDVKVTWGIVADKFSLQMQVEYNGPGKKWSAAADMEGRNATPQGMAAHILATMEARGVKVGEE